MNLRHGTDQKVDWRLAGGREAEPEIIAFDEFRIDCAGRRLFLHRQRVRIQRKPLAVLIYLARNHSRLVLRQELLDQFWSRTVNEEALTRCVSTIRRLLGDSREPPRYIETLWGQGYRFIAPISQQPAAPAESAPAGETDAREGLPKQVGTPLPRSGESRLARWLILPAAALVLVAVFRLGLDAPGGVEAARVRSIAVLPMAARQDSDRWLAAALTDHLVLTVSRIEGLKVIARGSAVHFSTDSDPVDVGAQLGVDALLVSQLERAGDLTGMRARLVSTHDGRLLWTFSLAPTAEGPEDNQVRRLAHAVARRLWANLQLQDIHHAVDPRAYRQYLRGRYYLSQRTKDALTAAIDAYDAALAIEPDYVDALLGLADSWLVMPNYSASSPDEAMPRARAAAERALVLDPGAAHAYAVLGVIAMQYDWDWSTAEAHLGRALMLNPNDATAEQWLGELHCYRGRSEECRHHLLAAAGLDPLSPVLRMMRGSPALFSGQFEAAIAAYSRALAEVPEFPFARYVLGLAYAGLGDWDGAIASYEASLPELGLAIVGGPLIFALARRGDNTRAAALLAELEALSESRYVPPTKLATAWLGLGDRERSLEALARALEVRDDRLVYLAVDAHFIELHEDETFLAVAERTGLLHALQAGNHATSRASSTRDGRPRDRPPVP